MALDTTAIVMTKPRSIELRALSLTSPSANDAMVDILWSGISTGTEKMLWEGSMPTFPGMGYPLVPGYESVGRIASAPAGSGFARGDLVFIPGANCFEDARGLFGASASSVCVPAARLVSLPEQLGRDGVLLALAATAYHALVLHDSPLPDLIVGHGVLGRLLARLVLALDGSAPTVWETNVLRRNGSVGYDVTDAAHDTRADYKLIIDASGDPQILDTAVTRLAKNGAVTLAGFYARPLSLNFAPAFMKQARFQIAAEFQPSDLYAVLDLISDGSLSLAGLITHAQPYSSAADSYHRAFTDPEVLKMVFEWETAQ